VLGGVVLETTGWLKPDARTAILSTLVWAMCMVGFAASPNYALSIALLLGAGVANLAAQSIAQTLVQLLAPADKRGRVIGFYNMSSSGLRAGSGITIGLVGGLIGIHWSLGLSAFTLVLLMVLLYVYLLLDRRPGASQLSPGYLARGPAQSASGSRSDPKP
jgi:MFS family permease